MKANKLDQSVVETGEVALNHDLLIKKRDHVVGLIDLMVKRHPTFALGALDALYDRLQQIAEAGE